MELTLGILPKMPGDAWAPGGAGGSDEEEEEEEEKEAMGAWNSLQTAASQAE